MRVGLKDSIALSVSIYIGLFAGANNKSLYLPTLKKGRLLDFGSHTLRICERPNLLETHAAPSLKIPLLFEDCNGINHHRIETSTFWHSTMFIYLLQLNKKHCIYS